MSADLLIIGGIVLAVMLAGGVGFLSIMNLAVGRDEVSERLGTYAFVPDLTMQRDSDRRRSRLVRLRLRLNTMLSVLSSEELSLKLATANWQITETEYIVLRILGTIVATVIGGWLFRSILSGLGFGLLAYLVPVFLLQRSIHNRRLKFEKQLVDVLVLVKGAVRSGYSFLQALDVVIQEMQAPASEEFRRVRREVGLGLPLSQALINMHARMQNDDLYLVVTAVNINSQVGGNLTTMLEAVTTTIRERIRLFSEIRALTSQQRYSGYLLTLLPFVVTAVLFILNPGYIGPLFEPGPYICIPIAALILVLIGNIVMRMLSRIDV
ncbi:MAG: type II secretion system F family protein [Anaerolineales bacterium]|nr:MAG: type II secretion system F family protein [Anaerolineales bacterium]